MLRIANEDIVRKSNGCETAGLPDPFRPSIFETGVF